MLLGALILSSLPVVQAEERDCVDLPVIMYHHMHISPERWGDYVIPPETLEGDLAYLQARGYETVTLDQLLDYVNGEGELPEKPILITFDDGQESFVKYGLPILEKYQMSAVLAIVGKYADDFTATEDHNINYSHISWPALGELAENPYVELQSHTYDMHKLTERKGCSIMPGEAKVDYVRNLTADLSLNEERFEQYVGEKPIAFAYPYGRYCDEAFDVLKDMGYKIIFTCESRVNKLTQDGGDCLLNLGRYNRSNKLARESFFAQMGIV